jgi:hypothetical protein
VGKLVDGVLGGSGTPELRTPPADALDYLLGA